MNGFLKLAAGSFCFILFLGEDTFSKEWRGIVPLHSTRADVARLYKQITGAWLSGVGLPQDSFNIIGEGMVNIQYSRGGCVEGWKVKRDTVVGLTVNLTKSIPFEDMRAEIELLPSTQDHTDWLFYNNNKDGVYYAVHDGKVKSITYGPVERDLKLRCGQVSGR